MKKFEQVKSKILLTRSQGEEKIWEQEYLVSPDVLQMIKAQIEKFYPGDYKGEIKI